MDGAPTAGILLVFSAPPDPNQPGASFDGNTATTVFTDANGIATAPPLLANGTLGSYTITALANVGGTNIGPAVFSESNAVPPTASAGGPYTIAAGQPLTLNAAGSSQANGLPLIDSWTINGIANAATGVNPTLTWAQLQSLGIDDAPATFTISVGVSIGGPTVTATTSLTFNDTPPTVTVTGLPAGSVPEASPIPLTASVTDPSMADTRAGFNELWQVSNGAGQTLVTGQMLTFNDQNPTTLPAHSSTARPAWRWT